MTRAQPALPWSHPRHLARRRPRGAVGLVAGVLLVLAGTGCKSSAKPDPNQSIQQLRLELQRLFDKFHDTVYRGMTWDDLTWLGIHAQQNPNDVWSCQQILFETKPDFVIETGTNDGGGALVWATLLSVINPNAKVLTVDIVDKTAAARKVPLFQEKVEFFLGSSTSEAVFGAIKKRIAGKKAMVILDSLHQKSHVLDEMMIYGDMVPVGGYMLVQDTDVNGHPTYPSHGPGPWEAVDEFMEAGGRAMGGATFAIDRSRELLYFTMHPRGYLRRVQ
jgi:cephalosporin hydroxylase